MNKCIICGSLFTAIDKRGRSLPSINVCSQECRRKRINNWQARARREGRKLNPEKFRAYARQRWKNLSPEKKAERRAADREYSMKNRDKIASTQRKWETIHRAKARAAIETLKQLGLNIEEIIADVR